MHPKFELNHCEPWEVCGSEDESMERFELLSAYIDGEATPQECKLVQDWLDTDPEFKQAYLGLIRIQTALPHVPVPESIPTEQLAQQVWARIEKENRWQRLWIWGSITAAAVVVAACSALFVNPLQPSSQQAKLEIDPPDAPKDSLMIAINEPMFDVLTENKAEPTPSKAD